MILAADRKIASALIRWKLWVGFVHMRAVWFEPRWGTRWILERMMRRQKVDDYGHAPACPANHWHRLRLVFQHCNCGAASIAQPEEGVRDNDQTV